MKAKWGLLVWVCLGIMSSCNRKTRYLDLNTNTYVSIKKDSVSGYIINSKTGEPVDVYVDTKTHDTVYGATGEIVNGRLDKTEQGNWVVRMDGEEYKGKSESENGEKAKREGDEYKLKNSSYAVKRDGDGDIKIENGRTQIKIDGKTGERKVSKDKNITDKVKKIFH